MNTQKHNHIHFVTGDLLEQQVDAIVNPWNRNIIPWWLLLPQGVSGAIKKQAGYAPFRELAQFGSIPLGHAVLTGAGRLPFKGIIHVAGINMLWRATEQSIRNSVINALKIAKDHDFSSIAFPLVGAGTGGYPEDSVRAMMAGEINAHHHELSITVVTYGKGV